MRSEDEGKLTSTNQLHIFVTEVRYHSLGLRACTVADEQDSALLRKDVADGCRTDTSCIAICGLAELIRVLSKGGSDR